MTKVSVALPGKLLVWPNRVAMTTERAENQSTRGDGLQIGLAFTLAFQQVIHWAMRGAGITPCPNFYRRYSRRHRSIQSFLKG